MAWICVLGNGRGHGRDDREKSARARVSANSSAKARARAAAKIGKGSEKFLVVGKGQEFPAHMPRVKPTLSLIYAVNPFGADHMSHEHDLRPMKRMATSRGWGNWGLADPAAGAQA